MLNGFKMFSFRCRSHVKEIILPKNMFGCPLKLILGFYGIFCISGIQPKYSYKIMYECEKSLLTHELSYIGLFNFFHLSLFHINVIIKSSFKKSLSLVFLFQYPNCEWTLYDGNCHHPDKNTYTEKTRMMNPLPSTYVTLMSSTLGS
jgi:hypothetical protein